MRYIAICGTVGAGKTTLLQRLTAYFGPRAAFHEERPQDNPYINEYYSDSKRWSFHSQVSFLSLYFDDEKWRPEIGDTEFFFFDRAFLENLVIAKYRLNQQDLTQDEFGILCKLAHGIASLMPPVDKYLYLDCSVSTIIEHMRQRGREYEDDLDLMYVYELKELYDEWAETLPPDRTLRISMDGGEYDLEQDRALSGGVSMQNQIGRSPFSIPPRRDQRPAGDGAAAAAGKLSVLRRLAPRAYGVKSEAQIQR